MIFSGSFFMSKDDVVVYVTLNEVTSFIHGKEKQRRGVVDVVGQGKFRLAGNTFRHFSSVKFSFVWLAALKSELSPSKRGRSRILMGRARQLQKSERNVKY